MSERATARQEKDLLKHFGLVTEDQLAALLGITVPTLRNRPREQLPEFTKKGRRRLFWEASVRQFLGTPER